MKNEDALAYSGYTNVQDLKKELRGYLGGGDIQDYEPLSSTQKAFIKKAVHEMISLCHKVLPLPTKNYIFVFPYLPNKKESVFSGVMGVAPYSCVFHLYISPSIFSKKVLLCVDSKKIHVE